MSEYPVQTCATRTIRRYDTTNIQKNDALNKKPFGIRPFHPNKTGDSRVYILKVFLTTTARQKMDFFRWFDVSGNQSKNIT
ncbi:MAG: hypothetical protein A2W28_10060 [Gammaproteobacteria bacterium RBG_16_51_14]|nr:MAG: hypothetical protein A2W28_10060 [Gammaproteobacteria bacterium RBG_16_51_14]